MRTIYIKYDINNNLIVYIQLTIFTAIYRYKILNTFYKIKNY